MDKINAGDTAWILFASALVMLMTPALGFFYGGLVRKKNVLSTIFYSFLILAGWEDPCESEANVAWARDLWERVRPMAAGVYVNYLGTEGEQRVREAYGPNQDRLIQIKGRYDPDNFFRMNQNIRPPAAHHS